MSTTNATTASIVLDQRAQRGLEIAAKAKIVRKGNLWVVPSQTEVSERRLFGQIPSLHNKPAYEGVCCAKPVLVCMSPST